MEHLARTFESKKFTDIPKHEANSLLFTLIIFFWTQLTIGFTLYTLKLPFFTADRTDGLNLFSSQLSSTVHIFKMQVAFLTDFVHFGSLQNITISLSISLSVILIFLLKDRLKIMEVYNWSKIRSDPALSLRL